MLASCGEGVLDPQGPVGLSERIILADATTIMLAVVIEFLFVSFWL
jgi:cytochrome o ubiquinol oxidase subunit 2